MAGGFALAQAFVRIRPDATGFRASADSQIKTALAGLDPKVKLSVNSDIVKARLAELRAYITALTSRAATIKIDVNDKAAQLAMQRLLLQLNTIDKRLASPRIRVEGVAESQAQILGIEIALDKLAAGPTGGGRGGWATKIPLFGGGLPGILGSIGAIRLLTSVTVEFLSVLIPATVAFASFAAVGADTIVELTQRFQIFNTVGRAMQQNLLPLGQGLVQMEKAAQPQVYALLGDALQIAGQKAGIFAQLTKTAGTVLDQLASRATLAIKGAGFSQLIKDAGPDLQQLGTVAGNIFGIIGNLLKGLTGYSRILLRAWVDLTGALEKITGSGAFQAVERVGLAFHGAAVYAGLLGTAVFLLGRPLGAIAGLFSGVSSTVDSTAGRMAKAKGGWEQLANSFQVGIGGARGAAKDVEEVGHAAEDTGGKAGLLSKAFGVLSGAFSWQGLAIAGAAALGVLIYALVTAKDATQQWTEGLQNHIGTQVTWEGAQKATQSALNQTAQQMKAAKDQVQTLGATTVSAAGGFKTYQQGLDQAKTKLNELTTAHQQFQQEAKTENQRMQQLASIFGSVTAAEGAMNKVGITAGKLATDNATQWAQDRQTLLSLNDALKAIADSAGAAGANERVMTYLLSDQYTNVTKLNSQLDTYVNLVTGTQTAFDAAAQGLYTLNNASGNIRDTIGKLSVTTKYAKSNIDDLSQSGLALNQAFSDQVGNFQKLFDTWRTAGLATNTITTGMKAAIATLLPFAAGSQEATAQLVGLANLAGANLPVDFQALQKWVGSTSDALGTLKNTSDEATRSQEVLAGAFQGTGNAIANKLIGEIQQSILSYDGVQKAADQYGQTVAQFGPKSDQAKAARQRLVNDLVAAGVAAGQSKDQISQLVGKILGIPASAALKIIMSGSGSYFVSGSAEIAQYIASGGNPNGMQRKPVASGGYISGPGTSTSDSIPASLSNGEYVVRASAVSHYGTGLMNAINSKSFAAGGLALAGNTRVLTGQYAADMYGSFAGTTLAVLISSMRTALFTATQAAMAAARAAGAFGVYSYDSGGYLPPGLSMAYNGTGRPEQVGGGGSPVRLEIVSGADTEFGQFIVKVLRRFVRVQGGGNVQVALGRR